MTITLDEIMGGRLASGGGAADEEENTTQALSSNKDGREEAAD